VADSLEFELLFNGVKSDGDKVWCHKDKWNVLRLVDSLISTKLSLYLHPTLQRKRKTTIVFQ
jgi:hypothetical protein